MKQERLQEIIKEELVDVLIENITRRFSKAVEAYQKIQLQQQQLRKKFVDEKDPKKKEALKQSLITLHKKVQKAESDFNSALKSEPIEDDLMEKSKGLWANIHAKRKRGEKPAKKGDKDYPDKEAWKDNTEEVAEVDIMEKIRALTPKQKIRLREKLVFYRDKQDRLRRFDTDDSKNKKYKK